MKSKEQLTRIWDAIWWEEWRDARDIAQDAGVDPGRTCEAVREAVRWMRDRGLPIVSSEDGFMKTISPTELVKFVRMMQRKADAIRVRGDRILTIVEQGWPAAAYQELAESLFSEGGGA